jgi:hypothetical protein
MENMAKEDAKFMYVKFDLRVFSFDTQQTLKRRKHTAQVKKRPEGINLNVLSNTTVY